MRPVPGSARLLRLYELTIIIDDAKRASRKYGTEACGLGVLALAWRSLGRGKPGGLVFPTVEATRKISSPETRGQEGGAFLPR